MKMDVIGMKIALNLHLEWAFRSIEVSP